MVLHIEYKIKNVDNLREKCEETLSRVSYNGDYKQNFFCAERDDLGTVITNWQNDYPELKNELENWKFCDKGTRFIDRNTVYPLHRGKKIACVFLKIFDSGNSNILSCLSVFGFFSIKVRRARVTKIVDRVLRVLRLRRNENEKRCIDMLKSCPKTMAALIMSEGSGSGLRIKWE